MSAPPAEEEPAPPAPVPAPPAPAAPTPWATSLGRERALAAVGLGLGPLLFLVFSRGYGLWDPFELQAAELARRVAVHALGAGGLSVEGADNTMPTLGDLGRMELPTTSMALSFRVFGLSEPAARVPMALWASVGLWALHTWLRRFSSSRVATFGALILTATPLYFVHARSPIGDVVAMAATLLAFAGLGIAMLAEAGADSGSLDPARMPRGRELTARGVPLAVGLLGLVAGWFSRGALLGVGVPLASVGLVGLASPGLSTSRRWASGAAVALAAGITVATLRALTHAAPGPIDPWLGSAVLASGRRYATFDTTISTLAYGLFPWSALLPFGLVRLFARPPHAHAGVPSREQADSRLRSLLAAGLAFGSTAHMLLLPTIGHVPFVFVGLAAATVAIGLDDIAATGRPSRGLAYGAALIAGILALDLRRFPEKGVGLFGLRQAAFPHSFERAAQLYVGVAALLFAGGVIALSQDDDADLAEIEADGARDGARDDGGWGALSRALRRVSVLPEARWWLAELGTAMNGNVAFVAIMAEAALVGVAAVVLLGDFTSLLTPPKLSPPARLLALSAFLLVPLSIAGTFVVVGSGRRLLTLALARARVRRGSAMVMVGLVASGSLFFGYFPALAAQLSPRPLFVRYGEIARPGEPLGLLGVSPRSAAYYSARGTSAGAAPVTFQDTASAFSWLVGGAEGAPDARRFLAVRADRFAAINALFREHADDLRGVSADHNVPVLDAHSSELMLLSNELRAGEASQNPLQHRVTTSPGTIAHPVAASFGGELRFVGWNLVETSSSAPITALRPGQAASLQLVFEVLQTPTTEWDTFVHLDGYGRRFTGDHKPLDGAYPMRAWQPGDFVIDSLPILLDPSFAPGTYHLFAGFFVGDDRMPVFEGRHRDNRLELGPIPVTK